MSGRSLTGLWSMLSKEVKFGAPQTPIDRFLGVKHTITRKNGILTCSFDMSEFARSCVQRYCELTGKVYDKLPKADTPAYKETPSIVNSDAPGAYASIAPSLLMKPLYLARCARPELSFTIAKLARKITKRTRGDDHAVDRLYAYIKPTEKFTLTGSLKIGCSDTLFLRDYPDADLAGCADTARSTSGMWIEIDDGCGNSFPIEWSSKLQTVVSHSTPEAELVSMSRSMREFALPIQGMWASLLDRQVKLQILEDNMSTIEIIRKGFSSKLSHLSRTHKISLAWTAEQVAQEFVELLHCPTALQKGDLFTKALDRIKHQEAINSIGIRKALAAVITSHFQECKPSKILPTLTALICLVQGGLP